MNTWVYSKLITHFVILKIKVKGSKYLKDWQLR